MKTRKRFFTLFLSLLLLFALATPVLAAGEQPKTVTMLCYNVAGLPSVSGLMGQQGVSVSSNQCKLGKLLNKEAYDVIAVQEDFNYDPLFRSGLTNYRYKTDWSGGIPGGDGMNIFAKVPIYNAKRFPWDEAYGVIENGADELTLKGILYAVLDFGNGILVDFYNIHADAFDDQGSLDARESNFNQLMRIVEYNSRENKRPIIITGDFNTSTHLRQGAKYTQMLIDNAHFSDAWVEVCNSGNYAELKNYDYTSWSDGDSWGNWDSAEKFLYRDGGGIHIEATHFEYKDFQNNGKSISDHKAALVSFTLTKGEHAVPSSGELRVNHLSISSVLVTKALVTVQDICKILTKPNEILGLFRK